MKIARGSDWKLAVQADAALGREIPEIVEVRYSTSEGARGRENMSREGVVSPGEAPFQNYAHTFKSVLSPLGVLRAGWRRPPRTLSPGRGRQSHDQPHDACTASIRRTCIARAATFPWPA